MLFNLASELAFILAAKDWAVKQAAALKTKNPFYFL
jgi:hypothetical protein